MNRRLIYIGIVAVALFFIINRARRRTPINIAKPIVVAEGDFDPKEKAPVQPETVKTGNMMDQLNLQMEQYDWNRDINNYLAKSAAPITKREITETNKLYNIFVKR